MPGVSRAGKPTDRALKRGRLRERGRARREKRARARDGRAAVHARAGEHHGADGLERARTVTRASGRRLGCFFSFSRSLLVNNRDSLRDPSGLLPIASDGSRSSAPSKSTPSSSFLFPPFLLLLLIFNDDALVSVVVVSRRVLRRDLQRRLAVPCVGEAIGQSNVLPVKR